MKFFVPDGAEPDDLEAATQTAIRQGSAYAAYLAEVRERLPEALRYIAEWINFGDSLLEELDVDLEAAAVTLRIGGETITFLSEEKTFRLRFGGVTRCVVTNAGECGGSRANSLEAEIHEVELIAPDLFEFRLLFHGRAEIAVRFREFGWEVVPDEHGNVGLSLEVAEEIAGVATDVAKGKLDARVLRDLLAKCAGGNAYVHYRLGKMALDGRYYALTAEQFRLSLASAPDHSPTRFQLARTLYLAGDYAGASPHLDAVLRENPTHPGALRYRALVSEQTVPPVARG